MQTERMHSRACYQHTQEERHARYAYTGSQPQTLELNLHFSQSVCVCVHIYNRTCVVLSSGTNIIIMVRQN